MPAILFEATMLAIFFGLVSARTTLSNGVGCNTLTRLNCCDYIDGRSSERWGGMYCIPTKDYGLGSDYSSGNSCEPSNWIDEQPAPCNFHFSWLPGCTSDQEKKGTCANDAWEQEDSVSWGEDVAGYGGTGLFTMFQNIADRTGGTAVTSAERTTLGSNVGCGTLSRTECCSHNDGRSVFLNQACIPTAEGQVYTSGSHCEPESFAQNYPHITSACPIARSARMVDGLERLVADLEGARSSGVARATCYDTCKAAGGWWRECCGTGGSTCGAYGDGCRSVRALKERAMEEASERKARYGNWICNERGCRMDRSAESDYARHARLGSSGTVDPTFGKGLNRVQENIAAAQADVPQACAHTSCQTCLEDTSCLYQNGKCVDAQHARWEDGGFVWVC